MPNAATHQGVRYVLPRGHQTAKQRMFGNYLADICRLTADIEERGDIAGSLRIFTFERKSFKASAAYICRNNWPAIEF